MNTEQLPAFGTSPPLLLVSNEMSYAELLYAYEIVDHAHSVFGSVAFIQVIQPVAREPDTTEAVPGFALPYCLTVLDSAGDAGFWFDAIVTSATGAWALVSGICDAETTVHATGSNQHRRDHSCLC
jgi:hypothetical protein